MAKNHTQPQSDASADLPVRLIVRRGALRRFDALTRKALGLPIVIEWDRRVNERGTPAATAEAGGRTIERRQAPPFTWELADFVVAPAPESDTAAPETARAEAAHGGDRRRSKDTGVS